MFLCSYVDHESYRNEYMYFIEHAWTDADLEKVYKGGDTKPEDQLKRMEGYLTKMIQIAGLRVDLNTQRNQNEIGGPRDTNQFEPKFGKRRWQKGNEGGGASGNTNGGIQGNGTWALDVITDQCSS